MINIRGQVRGIQETVSAFSQLPSLLRQAAEAAMRESLELVSTTARRDFLSGPHPERLQPRTGRLRASLRRGDNDNIFEVKSQGSQVTGTLGTNVIYARIHETGGVIKPKRGQYLAIPTNAAKTPRGVVKAEFNRPLRTIPGLFLLRSGSRQTLGAYRRRGRGRLERLFSLVRQVIMPRRPFLAPSLEKSTPQIIERFRLRFQTVLDRLQQTLSRLR